MPARCLGQRPGEDTNAQSDSPLLGRRRRAIFAALGECHASARGAGVRLYLERPARALAAVDETTRQFYQAIESQRMDLAARTAVVEGVDLFLQSREFQPIACRQ